MRTLLDIGLQKTGSKARQLFFSTELRRVNGMHAFYSCTSRQGRWHRPLYESLARGDRSPVDSINREIQELADSNDLMIISYEELYKLHVAQIRWLKESLPNPVAIIFLRRQDQLINSYYNQLHKSHRSPLQKLDEFEAGMHDYIPEYDYRAVLKRWVEVFGKESILPVIYHKGTSSVSAFFAQAGIEIDFSDYVESYPNRAMDSFGLSVLRWVKRLTSDDAQLPLVMTEAHRRLARHFVPVVESEERYLLTPHARSSIMEHYSASNEWVRSQFFPSMPSLFPDLENGNLVKFSYLEGKELAEKIVASVDSLHA